MWGLSLNHDTLLFLLFQGVWDKLYLNPLETKGHPETLMAYFGALGFTKLVEWLGLHTVPLPSLQY